MRFLVILLLFLTTQAMAWDSTGHRLISYIAYQNLTPVAKARIDQLTNIGEEKQYPPLQRFLYASVWPDMIRQQAVTAFNSWHYINSPIQVDQVKIHPPAHENVVWAINQAIFTLKSQKSTFAEKSIALRFLLHFTGDVHQPLHAATRFSQRYPNGDEGGGLYLIQSPYAKNLHQLWDQGAGLFHVPQQPYPLETKAVKALAQQIMRQYPKAELATAAFDLSPQDWANQSYQIAKDFVYTTPYDARPSVAYLDQAQQLAAKQIALAGYRLANLLNGIFTSQGAQGEYFRHDSERFSSDSRY